MPWHNVLTPFPAPDDIFVSADLPDPVHADQPPLHRSEFWNCLYPRYRHRSRFPEKRLYTVSFHRIGKNHATAAQMPQKVWFPVRVKCGYSGQFPPSKHKTENWTDKCQDNVLPVPDPPTDFSDNAAMPSVCMPVTSCAHFQYTDPHHKKSPFSEIFLKNQNARRVPHPRSTESDVHVRSPRSPQCRTPHRHRSEMSAKPPAYPDTAPASAAPPPEQCCPEYQTPSALDTDILSAIPSNIPHGTPLCDNFAPSKAVRLFLPFHKLPQAIPRYFR